MYVVCSRAVPGKALTFVLLIVRMTRKLFEWLMFAPFKVCSKNLLCSTFLILCFSQTSIAQVYYEADGGGSCSGVCSACQEFANQQQCSFPYIIKDPIFTNQCGVKAVCHRCDEGGVYVGQVEAFGADKRYCLRFDSRPYENTPKTQECGHCPIDGNPINFLHGHKIQSFTDYRSGGDFPLVITRAYTSFLQPGSSTADHWSFNYSGGKYKSLELLGVTAGEYAAKLISVDGSALLFGRAEGDALFSGDPDTLSRLEQTGFGWQVIDPGDGIHKFDPSGRLIAVVDRSGRSHTYEYVEETTIVTDQFGKSIEIVKNEDEQVISIKLPDGSMILYDYLAEGLIEKVTYSDNSFETYHYENDVGLLTGITDERNIRHSTFTYNGRSAASSEHAGGVNNTQFLRQYLQATITNSLGKITSHTFKFVQGAPKITTSKRWSSTYSAGSDSYYAYDSNGFVSREEDWEGNVTAYIRNSRGLATSTTYAQGSPEEWTVNTQWHSQYRLPEIVTEPDRTITYNYSPYDNPNHSSMTVTDLLNGRSRVWSYTHNQYGQVLTMDGPRGDVTDVVTYTYNNCSSGAGCGQLATMTNSLGHVTTFNSYDAHGYPLHITDTNGIETTMTYDLRQRLTSITVDGQATTIEYELTGDIKRTTLPDGTFTEYVRDDARRLVAVFDGEGNRIDWELDNAGNRTVEIIKDPTGTIRKSLRTNYDELSRIRRMVYAHGGVTLYAHDKNDNQTRITDASSRVGTSEYDALDRLIKEIDAISGETVYTYDDRDNLTSVTDPEGLTTTYTYNGFDEVVTEISPDTGTTTYTYDEAGNLSTETDARGITATYTYDALNRLTGISYPDSSENISYFYDEGVYGIGRLSRITDASGSTEYGYDARGNITSVTQAVKGQSYTHSYSYNGANRLTGMTYPSGRSVSYVYDDSGRVNQIDSMGGEEGAEILANAIDRLPFGPIESLTLGNGIPRNREYDMDYRITNLTDGNVLIKGLGYSPVNNITAITDSVDSDLTQLFTYDNLDRLDFATGNYGEDIYTYDGIGNRQSFTRDGQTDSYSYGATSHRLQGVNGQGYQYDVVGNTLSDGARSYTYNNRNRLTEATANGLTTDYEHNALGQRVIKQNANTHTHYFYDLEGRLIGEADASSGEIKVEYAYLDGEPLVMWREAEVEPPLDTDTDGDGIADETDPDDDNDGQSDVDELACGSDPLLDSSVSADNESDGSPDCVDLDDDNDGVEDQTDAFPLDPSESADADNDGIGDNADPDDNNNGIDDDQEAVDTDGDGVPDITDPDDDNDGVLDAGDAFPLDTTESVDTDGDGTGNNADSDDDNDGVDDSNDAFPLDPNESSDSDGDGIGDNADPDTNNPTTGNDPNITAGTTNDWGSGFNATFVYEVQAEDTQSGALQEWAIALGYTGPAQINNAWMTAYNGSVVAGVVGDDYVITNEGVGYTPTLSAGDTITFTVSGSGAAYDLSDFNIEFTPLDDEAVPPNNGGDPISSSAGSTNVNDWGSGFNASFECELPGSGPITDFLIDFNYSGSANLTNSWMQGYNGGITFGSLASDGGYAIEPSGYVPPLNGGDVLSFTVQGSGSGYTATDFDVQCVTGGGL